MGEALILPQAKLVMAESVRTAGDVAMTSMTWANVDNGLDLVLPAKTNDYLEIGLCAVANNGPASIWLDAHTIVGGTPVNAAYFRAAPSTQAYPDGGYATGWFNMASEYDVPGTSPILYPVQAADLESGQIRLRLRAIVHLVTGKTLRANVQNPLRFWAINLGPRA